MINFDSNVLKIDKKPYNIGKKFGIYYIACITMKGFEYVKINILNPLYFIIGEADGYIEKNNENKYLIFASADKNKQVLKKYTELWDKIRYLIKAINDGKKAEYQKDFMNIKFYSDDKLPLNKNLKLHMLLAIVRPAFQEDSRYCPQVFLDESLHEVEYDRIDISEGVNVNKTNTSKECDICHS